MTPSKEDEVGFTSQQWAWFPDEKNTFLKGYIVDSAAEPSATGTVKVHCEKTGSIVEVNEDKLEKVNPPKFDKCDDMASLTYLNEPSVLHNLRLRYQDDLIYTYSGLFLVAVNPYKSLDIYSKDFVNAHHNTIKQKKNDQKPKPHIFAITENAFQNLINDKQHQSILVTGESGAGKTENTKKIIQYLTSITSSDKEPKESFNFEQKILEANPILESFGNAQTLKNNNSSRFGKFIKLEFSPVSKQLIGANIEWYLLEKSRVVHQDSQERNYHIFYQILSGLSDHELSALNLQRSVSHYNYLNKANFTIPGMDDKQEYKHLINALKTVNFGLKEIANIIKVLAVILLLGNIEFTNPNSDKQAMLTDSSPMKELCKLLEISDRQLFINCFLKPKVKAGKEFVTQQKNPKQARFSIDALAKSLYEKLFEYIVDGINRSFINEDQKQETSSKFIGILDIAGFEIFPKNSFEQLCINYTNERLQQFFNHHMFVLEQNEYLKENLNWKFIDFGNDLIPTINLIEKKNKNEFGIFAILDEECIVPNASDKSFLDKLNQNLENRDKSLNKDSLRYRPNKNRTGFVVKHYAGEVEYDTDGWLDKNRDPLNDAVVEIISTASNNQFIKNFYKQEAGELLQIQTKQKGSGKQGSMLRTVAQRHKTQLGALMDQLASTDPHFVRCILPNNNKKLGEFDNDLILNQLRCNGVLEGVRIARAGYPNRIIFKDFYQRYKILCKNQSMFSKSQTNATLKRNCELLLGQLKLDTEIFKVGSTKLFFKNGVLADLEKRREHTIEDIMVGFQSCARGKLNRDIFRKKLLRLQASQVISENFKDYNKLKDDPWFSLFVQLKPLVDSSDLSLDKKVFNDKIKKLKEEISVLKSENSSMQTENKQFNSKFDQINQSLAKQRELLENKENELENVKKHELELQEALRANVDELKKLKNNLTQLIDENDELKTQFTQSTKSVEETNTQVESLNLERDSLKEKIESLSTELATVGLEHTKSTSEHASLLKEIKMLKSVVKGKDIRIKELEAELETSTKNLEAKLANANTGYSAASKKLKEAIALKDELQLQLSKLKSSQNSVDVVVKKKEEQLKTLTLNMEVKKTRINELETERDTFKSKLDTVQKDLLIAKEELKKLAKKHQRLQNDLEQSRSLLASKIEDDVKFSRGKQVHDRDILELKETINDLKVRLMSNGGNSESDNLVKSLQYENKQMLKMKKDLDVKIAELTFQLRNRTPPVATLFDNLHTDKKLQEDYASLKLQLNESTTNNTRVLLENKHLKEEISLMQTRLASESYENRQLKLERNNRLKADSGEVHNDENMHPRSLSPVDRPSSREAAELRIQLDSEKRTSKRIELLNMSLQKELLQYKNHSKGTETEEYVDVEDLKAKYQIAEAKVMALKSQLKNTVSSPLVDSTQSILNGATSPYRSSSTIQNENLRLSAKLNELASQLKRYRSTNISSTLKQDEFDNLKSRFTVLETTNADLTSSLELYKRRANEYYGKLESADAAVKSARRSEELLRREKTDMKKSLETFQKESKLNDNKMVKLNSNIRELEQKLADLTFENLKLSKGIDLLNDKYNNEKELRSSTSSQVSQTHAKEIKQLNDEIKERMEHETEMGKTIKYLSLELDDTKKTASTSHAKVIQLSELQQQLEKQNLSLKQQNDKLTISKNEIENKLESLASQVTALRSMNENIVLERDNLLETKRSLEVQVKSVTDEFNKFLAKNAEDTAKKVSINKLQQDLANEKELSQANERKFKDNQEQLQKMMDRYNSLKQDSITSIEENKLLTKFNTQLIEKMKDHQLKLSRELEKTTLTWQDRVKNLENKIKELNDLKINDEQNLYNMNKMTHDMKSKYEEQLNLTSRYRLENHDLDKRLNQLNVELERLRAQESKSSLMLKRSERELNEYKETCLNLEKELLNWKSIS